MERLKGGIFITAKEICVLSGQHLSNAQKEHKLIRDSLGKKGIHLTVSEYCKYHQLDLQEVIAYLNHYR